MVLESDEGPKPLLIAGGRGNGIPYHWESGNRKKKPASKQVIFAGAKNDIYTAGAGFSEAPEVSNLAPGCIPPKTFKDGLTGGIGEAHGSTIGRVKPGFLNLRQYTFS